MSNLNISRFGSMWCLRRAGGKKAIDTFGLRRDAITAARKLAKKDEVIFVHNRAGVVVIRIPELKPKAEMKVAAVVHIKSAANMTNKGRQEIAAWLRKQAAYLVSHGAKFSNNYRGRYYYA
jgi:hypothetical protein